MKHPGSLQATSRSRQYGAALSRLELSYCISSGMRLGGGTRAASGRSQAWNAPCPASPHSAPSRYTGRPRHRVTAGQAESSIPSYGV
jgi:hypothetical protein